MLSALLPGVREFRTPLVTGVLWASCAYLIFGQQITSSPQTDKLVLRFGLGELPSSVWLGAAALAVYLVGSLLLVRTSPVSALARFVPEIARRYVERLDEPREPARRRHALPWSLWQRYAVREPLRSLGRWSRGEPYPEVIDGWLRNEFDAMVARGRMPMMRSFEGGCEVPTGFDAYYTAESVDRYEDERASEMGEHAYNIRAGLTECFVREVKNELPAVEARIQMRFPEVYAEIDRLKVEGEMRLSIFWPLTLLFGLLGWFWSPLVLIALVMPPLLARDGAKRLRAASDKTWSALTAGEVSSPTLEAMKAAEADSPLDFVDREKSLLLDSDEEPEQPARVSAPTLG